MAKKWPKGSDSSSNLAERKGFEPLVDCSTAVFKTAAIDRSAISPLEEYPEYVDNSPASKNSDNMSSVCFLTTGDVLYSVSFCMIRR